MAAEISWSPTLGLTGSWDGQAFEAEHYFSVDSSLNKAEDLIIGSAYSAQTSSCNIGIVFGGLSIYTAPKAVLDTLGFITGT